MNHKLIMSVAVAASAWLGAPRTAEAIANFYSPFGTETQGAFGYVHKSDDYHYVAWFPGNTPDCAHVAWYIIGPVTGINEHTHIIGGAGPDQIFEWTDSYGDNICGYPASAPIINGGGLELMGEGGTDYIVGHQATHALWGGADNDRLVSYRNSNTIQIELRGGYANDDLCGCSTSSSMEYYIGDTGSNCFYDRSGSYYNIYMATAGTCGCSC